MKIQINNNNKKFMRLIGVIGEINNQNEKYIDTLKFRFQLVLNSIKDINNIDKDKITLIIDFLKNIRYRTSKIIHFQGNEIKFQKEIYSEIIM